LALFTPAANAGDAAMAQTASAAIKARELRIAFLLGFSPNGPLSQPS
jgi:hypothetical protein